MSTSKWTPEPWRAVVADRGYGLGKALLPIDSPRGIVAYAVDHARLPMSGQVADLPIEANAYLMAAAPDLYEALGLLLSFHESVGSPSPAAPCEMARAALAKARGEETS